MTDIRNVQLTIEVTVWALDEESSSIPDSYKDGKIIIELPFPPSSLPKHLGEMTEHVISEVMSDFLVTQIANQLMEKDDDD